MRQLDDFLVGAVLGWILSVYEVRVLEPFEFLENGEPESPDRTALQLRQNLQPHLRDHSEKDRLLG